MKRGTLQRMGATAIAATALAATLNVPAAQAEATGRHCVVTVAPAGAEGSTGGSTGGSAEAASGEECFATLADSLAFATDGGLRLPAATTAEAAASAIAAYQRVPHHSTVIGVSRDDDGWFEDTLVHRVNDPDGCADGDAFGQPTLGWWDDRIDRAWTFSGCQANYYFDPYFNWYGWGWFVHCTCPAMTWWERNQTSSILWYPQWWGGSVHVAVRAGLPGTTE